MEIAQHKCYIFSGKHSVFDIFGIFYVITPDGTRVEINRFFGEIDEETYREREEMSQNV